MQRFFRPEKLVHALNLLKGQIKSINDNLFLGKKKANGYVLDGISGENCVQNQKPNFSALVIFFICQTGYRNYLVLIALQ